MINFDLLINELTMIDQQVTEEEVRLTKDSLNDLDDLKQEWIKTVVDGILINPVIIKEPKDACIRTHFGGETGIYFEKKNDWPVDKYENNLTFIFQIVADNTVKLPCGSKMLQIFLTEDRQVVFRTYKSISISKHIPHKTSDYIGKRKGFTYAGVQYENIKYGMSYDDFCDKKSHIIRQIKERGFNPYEVFIHWQIELSLECLHPAFFGTIIGNQIPYYFQNPPYECQKGTHFITIESNRSIGLNIGNGGLCHIYYDGKSYTGYVDPNIF